MCRAAGASIHAVADALDQSNSRSTGLSQVIQTLDPSKLSTSDCVGRLRAPKTLHLGGKIEYIRHKGNMIPFPDAPRGFIYRHAPSDQPASSWRVRFRVTSNNSSQSFEPGSDLLLPSGKPWIVQWRNPGKKRSALREMMSLALW